MSRGGLHLQKIGGFFAYFREDKPRHLNYRIDIVKKDDKGIKDERIRKHKNKGWNFVCEKDIFLIFSSPEGSDLKELYETPEAQKLIIKESREKKLGKKFHKYNHSYGFSSMYYYYFLCKAKCKK